VGKKCTTVEIKKERDRGHIQKKYRKKRDLKEGYSEKVKGTQRREGQQTGLKEGGACWGRRKQKTKWIKKNFQSAKGAKKETKGGKKRNST